MLTSLEIKFYKKLLRVKRNTSTLAVRGELGRYPISIKAISRAIKFYDKITQKSDDTLVKNALHESIKLHEEGTKTWYTKLNSTKKVLSSVPYSLTKTNKHITQGNKTNEKRLIEGYKLFWLEQINSKTSKIHNRGGNKLRTYCQLKQSFTMERYLTLIEDGSQRSALTKLRVSAHPLNIETLRGKVQNPNERI